MRTRFLLTLILIALIGGTACNRSSKPAKQSIFMKRATGFAYEVLVVMDKDAWKGEAGRLLYDQLTAPIPGLPQNEPAMRVTYAEPSSLTVCCIMSATLSMSESMNPFIQKCLYIRKKTGGLRGRKWLRSTLLLPGFWLNTWKNKAHHWLLGWERKNGNGRPIIWKVRIASG